MKDTELQCRRTILTMGALLAGEPDSKQLTAGGFQQVLGRAGLAADRRYIDSVLVEFTGEDLMTPIPRTSLPRPDHVRYRITTDGEVALARMGVTHPRLAARAAGAPPQPAGRVPGSDRRMTNLFANLPEERAAEPDEEEAMATACMSDAALNAWWDTLSVDDKAEAMVNHFEVAAALESRFVLTHAGEAARRATDDLARKEVQ